MITAEDIIYNKAKNTERDFISMNSELLKDVESEIATFYSIINIGLLKGADFITGNKIYFISLLTKAENIIISSLHLARQRANLETLVLLRIAIETIATAIHIFKDDKAFHDYMNNKYKSTKSISYSKQFIPLIGKIWGRLSNTSVHINSITYGPEIEIDDNMWSEALEIDFSLRKSKGKSDHITLLFIQLVAMTVQRAFEIIFCKEDNYNGRYCFGIPKTELKIFREKYTDKINKLYESIQNLTQKVNSLPT